MGVAPRKVHHLATHYAPQGGAKQNRKGTKVTRKHYEQVAQALQDYYSKTRGLFPDHQETKWLKLETLADITEIMANIFEADNPRFDRGRFLSACVPNKMNRPKD